MNTCPHCSSCEIEVVLDRSGSMQSYIDDAIGGYNAWLASQQALPGAATLTLTLFDNEHITTPNVPLGDAQQLTRETYVPRGGTALNDSIGRALGRLEAKNPAKAILVILTDGQENSSTEFNTAQIKQRISAAQARGWQVVYLSADINAFAHARDYGVFAGNSFKVAASGAGMRSAMSTATMLNAGYRTMQAEPAAPAPDPYQGVNPALFGVMDTSASSAPADCGSFDSSSFSSSDSSSGSCDAGSI